MEGSILLGAGVVIAAIIAVRVAHGTGLPSLLIYLALGLLLGPGGLGIVFQNAGLAREIGLIALAVILAEGGLTTNWRLVRPAVPVAVVLATVGVGVSVVALAACVVVPLGMDWRLALLLGAVLASTDAAAVFSVLRRLPLPPRLSGVLEAESGFNDAPAVIIVAALSTAGAAEAEGQVGGQIVDMVLDVLLELAIGAAVGLVIGPLAAFALRRIALPASGLYPLAVFSVALAAYSGATLAHGSGFLAVYLAGLVLGNARLPHRAATKGFAEGAAWLAQIGLFVMLGMLARPSELPAALLPGLIAGFALILVARPISVVASALVARACRIGTLSWREQAFLSWAGLRGAVPIVLATIPWANDVPGAKTIFNEVFVIVIVFTLVQGPTLPFVARLLRVSAPGEARDLDVEAAPLEELKAELIQVSVPPGSLLQGVEIFELRLPSDAAVTMIVRDGHSFVPEPSTRIRAGDQLLVVTTAACREVVERRLRAVSRRGKLAGWYGEQGE